MREAWCDVDPVTDGESVRTAMRITTSCRIRAGAGPKKQRIGGQGTAIGSPTNSRPLRHALRSACTDKPIKRGHRIRQRGLLQRNCAIPALNGPLGGWRTAGLAVHTRYISTARPLLALGCSR